MIFRLWLLLIGSLGLLPGSAFGSGPEVPISKGVYSPFFRESGEGDKKVGPLMVDRDPVTNQDYLKFVRAHPQWARSRVPRVFSSSGYLGHWNSDEDFDPSIADQPVTYVSWFAARKYCESKGKRLMTVAEWEYSADSQNPENLELILAWYARPNTELTSVARAPLNRFGLRGMHGLIWEWVEDFSSVIIAGDSRDTNETSGSLFCGAGSLRAKDATQYATFMRFAHRSSLKAHYIGATLGFRCVRSLDPAGRTSRP